jgi:Ca2+-binding RTX toxin-like protein
MVNLGKGTAIDGFGNRDTFKSIEGVRGSNYDDVLKDSGVDNWLSGRDGDDVICVDNGDDTLEGGSGADVFQFKSKSFGDNTIRDFEDGVDMIEILHAKRFSQLTIEDTDDGATLISYRGSSITVDNVSASDLTADDFTF